MLVGTADNEDAAVLSFPSGKAIVQTLDFFTPIVNDPYRFGQIAAANSLSDVYAMGGTPWCAMNIVCFPVKSMPKDMLSEIIRGGYDKIVEAGAVLAGGHSVEDAEIKYGLSVTGYVDADAYTSNAGLQKGDKLILTKPVGTGVLATAVKAKWNGAEEMEELLYTWAARLNNVGGELIRHMGLKAATDVTGFGLGGHLLEMAQASKAKVAIDSAAVPVLDKALELAGMGLVPEGSHANRLHCKNATEVAAGVDSLRVDLIFDAQTSGGLVLAVPEARVEEAVTFLEERGELATVIGEVLESGTECGMLHIRT
ncbi:selenide, water dikinase [Halodesulfovibrio spirochaetisodalis]|uniref:Selenide, water dikinase n=1 Tax=Halodesulfovibrio spirochaetisodalis TaxID=1560234 RepID=A0A1B7XQ02_9BACT|nr:selenide, water dikinase [Halodesulfovibrio spirochaetisodalis]